MKKVYYWIASGMLVILVIFLVIDSVIILHGFMRRPYGTNGVASLLAHLWNLQTGSLFDPVEQAHGITLFFLLYLGELYGFILVYWGRTKLRTTIRKRGTPVRPE